MSAFAQQAFERLPVAGQVHLFAGTGASVVVVDTSGETASGRILREVQALTTRPIRYVINTSGDADHVGGNERIAFS